jgi:hypothetical protein
MMGLLATIRTGRTRLPSHGKETLAKGNVGEMEGCSILEVVSTLVILTTMEAMGALDTQLGVQFRLKK